MSSTSDDFTYPSGTTLILERARRVAPELRLCQHTERRDRRTPPRATHDTTRTTYHQAQKQGGPKRPNGPRNNPRSRINEPPNEGSNVPDALPNRLGRKSEGQNGA